MAWETEDNEARAYNGRIDDACFTRHEKFGEALLLQLDVVTDAGYTRTLLLTTGPGWESTDGGKTATHPTRSSFSAQSNVGKLIDAVSKIPGAVEQINGEPNEAAAWIGQNYFWEEEKYSLTDRDTKEKIEKSRDLPKALANGAGGSVDAGGKFTPDAGAISQLSKAAKATTSHEDWVDSLYTVIEGFGGELETWALDVENYKSLLD